MMLAACIYVLDIRGFTKGSHPFVVLGSNAIVLFVLSGFLGKLGIIIKIKVAGPHGAPVSYGRGPNVAARRPSCAAARNVFTCTWSSSART